MSGLVATPGASTSSRELCVFVECSGYVCAVATKYVASLVLPDAVTVKRRADLRADDAGSSLLESGGQTYVAFDMGLLLGMRSSRGAYLLTDIPAYDDAPVKLAFTVGACLVVTALPEAVEVPSGVFKTRAAAVRALFRTEEMANLEKFSRVGLYLEPEALLGSAEQEIARAAVARGGSTP